MTRLYTGFLVRAAAAASAGRLAMSAASLSRAALRSKALSPAQIAAPIRAGVLSSGIRMNASVPNMAPAAAKISQSLPIFETAAAGVLPKMACFQCEQTAEAKGCSVVGVCGKTPVVSASQDVAVHLIKGIAQEAQRIRTLGGVVPDNVNEIMLDAMFATLTNVNFDQSRWDEYIERLLDTRNALTSMCAIRAKQQGKPVAAPTGAAAWTPGSDLQAAAVDVGIIYRGIKEDNPDVFSLVELLTYGLKGMMAYAEHASVFGKTDPEVLSYIYEALAYLGEDKHELGRLLELCMRCGEVNLKVMGMLNSGAVERFGAPQPTVVLTSHKKGKCILVSGHDLRDLEEILKLSEGKGINVYTHGELLPAHGYPGLKKRYPHLMGNYGGAWQLQKFEFPKFPGPIVMTTNCIIEPRKSYKDRIYTVNSVGYDGVKHIKNREFAPVIQHALQMEGFTEDAPETRTMTGFGHHAVLGIADQVVDAVKAGKIKRFFLIGGCDGSEAERSYYADLAHKVPKDCVILTLACGKYRFIKEFDKFGNVEGTQIPRLLDVGQCNDAYSAVRIAGALAEAFKTDVNGLPLSFAISFLEQKAVAVLLTLLHLNIQNIRLGPRLPAFVSPTVLGVLADKFKLKPVGDAGKDLEQMMLGK